MTHMERAARAECAHVIGRHVAVRMNDLHGLGLNGEHLGHDLRHCCVGPLPHVDRVHVQCGAAVGADIDDGDRGGGRDRGLEADRQPAAAPDRAAAAIEGRRPVQSRRERVEHLGDRRILHRGAGRLWAALAQDIPATERERIDIEGARNQVGVALIGPDQLRNAEAAQRAGRRPVGVELVGIDLDVVDVVGPGRCEAGFLGHPRPDIRIGAAVPKNLALARRELAVPGHRALDAERRGMLGDDGELLVHGERELDGPAHQQGERRHQRLELDIDLGAESAPE